MGRKGRNPAPLSAAVGDDMAIAPTLDEPAIRLKCLELAMMWIRAGAVGATPERIAEDFYDWVMGKPEGPVMVDETETSEANGASAAGASEASDPAAAAI